MNYAVLIFAYYSYKDPVFQSAVLPYFTNQGSNTRFVLLTFEKPEYKLSKDEILEIEERLSKQGIFWYRAKWHSGALKPLKKFFDFIYSVFLCLWIVKKERIKAIYSEGFPGAIIGHFIAKINRIPHCIHTFEPHAEYMLEAGVWSKGSWEYILLKNFQYQVAKSARIIITGTNAMVERLKDLNVPATLFRLPSCVDEALFKCGKQDREKFREQLGFKGKIVIVYCGKFGGMYLDHEIFTFFQACEKKKPELFKFLILSHDAKDRIMERISRYSVNRNNYQIYKLNRNEVPEYLCASDFGLVPIKQVPSKRFCSPIKSGEYWACGLPVIIPEGISDDFIFTNDLEIGHVLKNFTFSEVEKTINYMVDLSSRQDKMQLVKEHCRKFAIRDRSISGARRKISIMLSMLARSN